MPINEIVVLLIVILFSVTGVCLLLNSTLKNKPKKQEKKQEEPKQEKVEETIEPIKEEPTEEIKEVKEEKHEKKEKTQAPPISIALQDELDEFKNYLKSRISPETTDTPALHPYDTPKVNRFDSGAYTPSKYKDDFKDDFDLPDFDKPYNNFTTFDDEFSKDFNDFEFSRRKTKKKEDTSIQNLPDKVKIMLFTNFFDTKY